MAMWTIAAAFWTTLSAFGHHNWRFSLCLGLSILLGGITTSGLIYLLVEWTMRPTVAMALAGDAPTKRIGPGVRTKLVLAWMIGSDVFLLLIGLTVLGRPADQPPSRADIFFIILAGFVAGTLVLYVAIRSLVTPLLELRQAVDSVTRGELDVSLSVNDGGEIGMVQAGFNRMVAGLQERRTLEDLFGRHVGTDVARLAVAQGDVALGGERRDVGVVFVDVIGSTQLAQSRAPEEVVTILNQLFATIVRVVSEEGGWVNKFQGDGALCVFGAPVSTSDYAQRALRAARTLRRELLALAMVEPALDAAIGVSAGTAVAGNVGAEQRYEYTVMGSPVNEASRLTTEAKQRLGRVLASEEVITRAGTERSGWRVAREVQLRGYEHSILVYEPSDKMSVDVTA
jgi:adenylate cyclase